MTTPDAAPAADRPHDWDHEPPTALASLAYRAPLYEYAALADRKASFYPSAGGLMLTVLGFFLGRIVDLVARGDWQAWGFGLALAAVAVLVVLSGVIAYVAFARLLPPTPPSLAVFRDIAARTPEAYARDVLALSHEQAFADMLRYNHVVARWGAGKSQLVNRALALLRVAIPLWMLLLLVLAVAG